MTRSTARRRPRRGIIAAHLSAASHAGGTDVLTRADGVQMIGEMEGSGYRSPPRWLDEPTARSSS